MGRTTTNDTFSYTCTPPYQTCQIRTHASDSLESFPVQHLIQSSPNSEWVLMWGFNIPMSHWILDILTEASVSARWQQNLGHDYDKHRSPDSPLLSVLLIHESTSESNLLVQRAEERTVVGLIRNPMKPFTEGGDTVTVCLLMQTTPRKL